MILKKESGLSSRKKIIIILLVVVFIFGFGVIGFYTTDNQSLSQGFITTLEVLSFSYHGNDAGLTKVVRVLLSLFGVVFFWLALGESFNIAVESNFINHFGEANIMNQIKKLKNHYIICGGGRVGYHVASLLKAKKKPYVIVEKDEFTINQLRKKGFLVYEADSLEESTLVDANIKSAKVLMSVLPESEKNILVILTARELNKKLKIYARSNREEYIKRMKKAGADFVVTPEISCAEELINLSK